MNKDMRNSLLDVLPENIATRIKLVTDLIVDLANSLETEEDLWDSYKNLNQSMMYLSARHTIAKNNEEYIGGTNKD